MDADLDGAGAADDAGAGVLLRRAGALEERAQHDDDELHLAGFVGVLWAVVGYSLAFAPGNDWIGDLSRRVPATASASSRRARFRTCSSCAYQGTFAIITAALISGAIVERMRFSAYVVFITLWVARRLQPDRALGLGRRLARGHGRARLRRRHGRARQRRRRRARRRDRASASAATIRRRRSCRTTCRSRCSAPACSGSAGSDSTPAARWRRARSAALAFTTTMLAPSGDAGRLDPPRHDAVRSKPTAVGAATAIVVGLVAITPAAGFISPMSAIALGAIAAVPSYFAPDRRARRRRSTIRSTSSRRTASAARSARC